MPDEVLDDTGRPQLADPESAERLGFRPEVRDQRFARAAPFVCLRHLSRSFLAAQAYHPVPYLARFHQRRRCRGVPSRRADRVGYTEPRRRGAGARPLTAIPRPPGGGGEKT